MFGKVFSQMFEGSMYGAGADLFAVWTWVLSHMVPSDNEGQLVPGEGEIMWVELNPKKIGDEIGIGCERVMKCVDTLSSPDPISRTNKLEGKRIQHIEGFAFWVVNGIKYRDTSNEEDRRHSAKMRKRAERAKLPDNGDWKKRRNGKIRETKLGMEVHDQMVTERQLEADRKLQEEAKEAGI